jgi:hypothetical protein
MYVKFVIWDGLLFVNREEKLYVGQSTMLLHNYFKENNMGLLLIYGV